MKRLRERQGWSREIRRLGEPREKLGEGFYHRFYSATHGEFNPHAKAWVIIFLAISIIGGIFIIDQGLKSYATIPLISVQQDFWNANGFPASANEFRLSHAVYTAGCITGHNCITLQPTSTIPGVAMLKQPISIDTISSHEFGNRVPYCFASSPANLGNKWGVFLRRNGTLPSETGYNPENDPSVSFIQSVTDTGSGSIISYIFLQKNQTDPIINGDSGEISGVTQGTGTMFLRLSTTQDTGVCNVGAAHNTNVDSILNFTGSGSASNPSVSTLYESNPGTASVNQVLFPWLNFQGLQFYLGYYQIACSAGGCANINIVDIGTSSRMDPPKPSSTTPASVDTGGFFGPIIKALISIGAFIAQNLIGFFNWLVNFLAPLIASGVSLFNSVIVAIFNALGSLFGDSSLGTQISQFFSNVATFLSNVFANAIALLGNIVDMAVKSVSFLSGFLTNNSFTTLLIGFFGSLANVWTILNGIWADIAKWFVQGSITAAGIMEIDWALGTIWTAVEGTKGFKEWLDINEMVTLRIFNGAYWFFKESTDILSKLWMAVKGRVSPVEVAGTG